MVQTVELEEFIIAYTSCKKVNEDSDIYSDLDLVGDDFHDFIDAYAKKYEVDISSYLWYFHGDEEGNNFGGLLFKPPYARVQRIPVTPILLAKFANTRKWEIPYPEHHLPKYRYDLLLNRLIAAVLLVVIVAIAASKFS
ncbi:DUF1493 family protein [Pontibacter sp. 13R65]|uniref:DUF1493 family protein n=1 Tax=Pontibacter sp. 13R65 TaxID=3127458 RepID=UPI00301BC218